MKRFALLGVFGAAFACCGEAPCTVPNSFALEPGEATGPMMRPGNNCLRCHSEGGQASSRPFSVGGTVFERGNASRCEGVAGVIIEVTDAKQKRVVLTSNAVGNFYSDEPLTPPLSMVARHEGRSATMSIASPTGGCALCHSWPDAVSASGRIRAP